MSDTIQEAAAAFSRDMGEAPARGRSASPSETSGKPEVLFDAPGQLENEEEEAGGDRAPPPRELQPKPENLEREYDDQDEEGDEQQEGDEEGSDAEGDEEEEGDDPLAAQTIEVIIDGEPAEISVREAAEGYIRRETFDRRMNALAEGHKLVKSEAEKVVAKRTEAAEMFSIAEAVLAEVLPPEPDWDKLFAENPAQAREIQKQYQTLAGKVREIVGNKQKVLEKQQRDEVEALNNFRDEEWPKFAAQAKWRDKEEQQKDMSSMRRTMLDAGYSEKDIPEVRDSKMLVILRWASKYKRMIANKPKPVTNGSKRVTPGAASDRPAPKGSNAQRKLSKTGSMHDAVPVFQQLLDGPRKRR